MKNVSLTVQPGEVIGIVGHSGSGKSTLAKLMQRFYTPIEGHILIDGVDINLTRPSWLRSKIGVVLQENLLFHDNIAIANPSMNRTQVMEVARLSGADVIIVFLAGTIVSLARSDVAPG